jgi:ATP-binding protein involved in chromosome partitioning
MRRSEHTEKDDPGLMDALGQGVDPTLFHRLSDLSTLVHASTQGDVTEVILKTPFVEYPAKAELEENLGAVLGNKATAALRVSFEVLDENGRALLGERLRSLEKDLDAKDQVTPAGPTHAGDRPNPFNARRAHSRILAIASGKGGVGKSSVTVNLAVALASSGHTVGLLDADIYGFSVPRMLGISYPPTILGDTIVPPVAYGVRCISMGFFADEDQAVAWRGPMLHKALEQFLVDVHWGDPEFLIIDMPPGTGDIALSVAQQLPQAELYVVTTPQPASERVAQRSGALARQVRLPIRGVIENMSYFEAPDGTRYTLFGTGGGQGVADALSVPLLAQIPLVEAVREGADKGEPAVVADPGGEVANAFDALAEAVVGLGPARVYRKELTVT